MGVLLCPNAQDVGGESVADPTQLPLALTGGSSVLPDIATVGSTQAALADGAHYSDPYTDVTVVRLTDNSSPAAGSWEPSYSEGGPSCSLPWVGGDGHTYYTVAVQGSNGDYLMDIDYDVLVAESGDPRSNIRTATYDDEIGIAFSLDPSQPRICYLVDSDNKRINRYDTATDSLANTGNFPWNIAASGEVVGWLHTQLDDTWLACLLSTDSVAVNIAAWKPSTDTEIALSVAESGANEIDELRLDREDPTVYVVGGGHGGPRRIWHLETDTVTEATDLATPLLHFEHAGPVRGGIVMHCAATQDQDETASGGVIYRSDLDETINFITDPDGTHVPTGDFYTEGHWCVNLTTESRDTQWVTAHLFAQDSVGSKIRRGMMAWVKVTTTPSEFGEVRLIACHGSTGDSYDEYPQCFTSPDGKLLFWTSNMNNVGRFDAFMAKMPTT